MPYIIARMERKLERYCKIKDKDLRLWVDGVWVDEFISLLVIEFLSLWVWGLMSSRVVGFSLV